MPQQPFEAQQEDVVVVGLTRQQESPFWDTVQHAQEARTSVGNASPAITPVRSNRRRNDARLIRFMEIVLGGSLGLTPHNHYIFLAFCQGRGIPGAGDTGRFIVKPYLKCPYGTKHHPTECTSRPYMLAVWP